MKKFIKGVISFAFARYIFNFLLFLKDVVELKRNFPDIIHFLTKDIPSFLESVTVELGNMDYLLSILYQKIGEVIHASPDALGVAVLVMFFIGFLSSAD